MKQIPLPKGLFATVDECDYQELAKHKWGLARRKRITYARRFERVETPNGAKYRTVLMHRQIMSPPDGMDIDHKNSDGLCNCRENLRVCTRSQNNQNARKRSDTTQRYKGIYTTWNGKFAARLWDKYLKIHIGVYDTPELAARAYDRKAKELFGEFAKLNFPNE